MQIWKFLLAKGTYTFGIEKWEYNGKESWMHGTLYTPWGKIMW